MKRVNEEQELEASQEVGILRYAHFIMHEEPILMGVVANADLDALFRLYDTSKACREKIDRIVAIIPLCTTVVIANFRIYNAFFTECSYCGSLVNTIRHKTTTLYINACALPQEMKKKKIFGNFPCLQNIMLRVDPNTITLARQFFTARLIHQRSVIVYHDPTPPLNESLKGQGVSKDLMLAESITHSRSYTGIHDSYGLLFFSAVAAAFFTNK